MRIVGIAYPVSAKWLWSPIPVMLNDNIFSGLKVVDFASFIAGPSAAVILSDFGADVIKVEPPTGDLWRHGPNLAID